ncbi:MAG TPA: ATP-binding protein [Candidatus Pacearchaeota archaeon]|nr:ATP-binding protein [Candidatus Pacearchaeota archaeon]HQM24534.1 ATP-binding protein [Candidatus Pacearchaeota archaeon]
MNDLLNSIIRKQKDTVEQMLSRDYVPRSVFAKANELVKTDLIKVIIGPRRSGKSVLGLMLLKNVKFAYLNLDDDALGQILKNIKSYDELIEEMLSVYGKTNIIFFDEIQNLDRWELFANKLHREGYNLILTGSNSKLLSRELSTHLTGRYFEIEVLPFSFREYLFAKKINIRDSSLADYKGEIFNHLNNYMISGGFPEVVVKDVDAKEYLSTLFDAVVFKDVVNRYKIRYPQKITSVGSLIINNVASEFSYRKLLGPLNVKSPITIEKYAGFLQESYLIFLLNKYSYKTKEVFGSIKKVYAVDNGLVTSKSIQFSKNSGSLMENLVFTELLKRGFKSNVDLFYYKTESNKGVDFLIRKGLTIDSLIQVSYNINDLKTEKRETRALIDASEELKCDNLVLITWDREELKTMKGKKIKYIPLWKWLLYNN